MQTQPTASPPVPSVRAAVPDDRCGSATDSTSSFVASAEALSTFLEASLREFAGQISKDRLTFPVSAADCSVMRMQIADLYDVDNTYELPGDRIYFARGHAYHFYSISSPVSFSNIAFFEADSTVLFESVNCTDRGDTVDDALEYIRRWYPSRATEAYLDRIARYRHYGHFRLTDEIVPSLLCACEICYRP